MSDNPWPTPDDIPDGDAAPPETEPAVPEDSPPADDTGAEVDVPTDDGGPEPVPAPAEDHSDGSPEVFDRKYVETLRNEAAENRVSAKIYKEAFDGYTDEQRDYFLNLAKGLNDPAKHVDTAREMMRVSAGILQQYGQEVPDLDPVLNVDKPLTIADIEAREAKQAADRATQESIAQTQRDIEGLGYKLGTPEFSTFLHFAQENSGDIHKADTAFKAYKQSIIDGFVAERQASKDKHLTAQPQVGSAPAVTEGGPKTFEDARLAVTALVESLK